MTLEFLASQIARLEANWGTPKDRTPGQLVAMTREWFSQLGLFGERTVELAFTLVIGTSRFGWGGAGPIADLVAFCVRDHREWREIVELQHPQLAPPIPEPFERDGRTTREEIEHRAKLVSEMKRAAGFKSLAEIEAEETPHTQPKQASLDIVVSPHLLNTCAARRARKLPTCHENCFRKACELRENEAKQ